LLVEYNKKRRKINVPDASAPVVASVVARCVTTGNVVVVATYVAIIVVVAAVV
jgi:hypothetical protein